jgi:chromosome segregation ATPase
VDARAALRATARELTDRLAAAAADLRDAVTELEAERGARAAAEARAQRAEASMNHMQAAMTQHVQQQNGWYGGWK